MLFSKPQDALRISALREVVLAVRFFENWAVCLMARNLVRSPVAATNAP